MNKNIQSVRPGMPVFRVSAKTGDGMEELLRFLASRAAESRTGDVGDQLALQIDGRLLASRYTDFQMYEDS